MYMSYYWLSWPAIPYAQYLECAYYGPVRSYDSYPSSRFLSGRVDVDRPRSPRAGRGLLPVQSPEWEWGKEGGILIILVSLPRARPSEGSIRLGPRKRTACQS